MPRYDPTLQKVTTNLRLGDFDYICQLGHAKGVPGSVILRRIVSDWVDEQRAKEPRLDDLEIHGIMED